MLGKITVSWIFHHLFFLTLIKLAEVQMELSERHSCVKCTHFRADVQSEAKRRKQISYFAYAMAKNKNREGVHTPPKHLPSFQYCMLCMGFRFPRSRE